ncbi:DNA (cytosine-5-)-methyltransferase [Mycoplasma sp. Z355B]|uniref:DNA (cytosine-5-)-methyltransferase n=1 Tax=unclassified Mycoplasma TaxID=2683645 RepID=UPI003AAC45A2
MKLKVAELFAGVGGFRVGLNKITEFDKTTGKAIENGPWEFVYANQWEPSTRIQHAFDCYATRFETNNASNVDITKVDKNEIPDHSLLVGGFPCQDYSVARSLSKESGIEGKKGVLFWEIKDVLKTKNTNFVLLENVDRLLKSPASRRGRDFAIMLKTFFELGYNVTWRTINAAEYHMPQKRTRVFIFAWKRDTKYNKKFQNKELDIDLLKSSLFNKEFKVDEFYNINHCSINSYKSVLDISDNYSQGSFLKTGIMIDGLIIQADVSVKKNEIYSLGQLMEENRIYFDNEYTKYIVPLEKLEKWKYLKGNKKIERISKDGHKYLYSEGAMSFPENLDAPGRTMLTSEGTLNRSSHIVFDNNINQYRILSEVECEALQMFPPNWTNTMPSKKRYFMMGNALVTGIIKRLSDPLIKIIKNE